MYFSAGDTAFTILLELEGRSVKVLEGGENLAFDHGEIIADAIMMDTTGDGEIDTVMEDIDGDGTIDIVNMDTTGDGEMDTTFVDLDGDGEMDMVISEHEISMEDGTEEEKSEEEQDSKKEPESTARKIKIE